MAGWQWFGRLHARVFRATGGRIGGRLVGLDVLLLTTTGRRSGLARTTPMPYFRDGERLVIVGSNGGADTDPAWWLNLQSHPDAEVVIGRDRLAVRAALASPEDRARLWPALKRWNPNYARYEKKTPREIPVVLLTPRRPGT
jgi:deazaflavin-dependent oxidoreductase (nitroreductase family)